LATEIVPFTADHLLAVRKFNERTWQRPATESFYRWRYLECPTQHGLLTLRNGECVATIWAIIHQYRMGEARVDVLEPFDWYVLPELVNSGHGIRVLQRFMRRPELMLTLGGTEFSLPLIRRLGWREVSSSCGYLLAFDGSVLARELEMHFRLPRPALRLIAGLVARTWSRPRRWRAPPRGDVHAVERLGDEVAALYEGDMGYRCVRLPNEAWHRWLSGGGEGTGNFVTLHYRVSGRLVGWALGRVYTTEWGREAAIVDIFTPRPDFRVYAWMVSALVERLASFRPGCIRTRVTCPVLGRGLMKNRFLRGPRTSALFWSRDGRVLPEPVHLTTGTADGGFVPYDLGESLQ
jgi:hypothetical protein